MCLCVSVIIPSHNPGNYIWDCLDSLYGQTIQKSDYEVIVVLNGCNEPYNREILDYIAAHKSMKTRYVQTDEKGVSHARNLALDIAEGEYIAFIDDDDYVSPEYLEELLAISDSRTIGLAYPFAFHDSSPHQQLDYRITSEYERCVKRGKQPYWRPKKFFSGPCMKLIHVSVIGERRFDTRFSKGEDSLYMFLLSDKMMYANFTSRRAVYYRRYRKGSLTGSPDHLADVMCNCTKMFLAYNNIYFSNLCHYSLYRYIVAVLGLIHIVIVALKKNFAR